MKAESKSIKERILNRELSEYRRKYMSKYGNMEIHRTVISGNDRFTTDYNALTYGCPNLTEVEKHQKMIYPIFTREKILPFFNLKVNTAVYNSVVLLFISFIINFIAYWMLSRNDFLMKIFYLFITKKQRR